MLLLKTGYKDICIRSSYRKTTAGLILLYKVFNIYKEVNTPKFFISKVNKGHDKQMKTLMRTVIGNERKTGYICWHLKSYLKTMLWSRFFCTDTIKMKLFLPTDLIMKVSDCNFQIFNLCLTNTAMLCGARACAKSVGVINPHLELDILQKLYCLRKRY